MRKQEKAWDAGKPSNTSVQTVNGEPRCMTKKEAARIKKQLRKNRTPAREFYPGNL